MSAAALGQLQGKEGTPQQQLCTGPVAAAAGVLAVAAAAAAGDKSSSARVQCVVAH